MFPRVWPEGILVPTPLFAKKQNDEQLLIVLIMLVDGTRPTLERYQFCFVFF